MDNSNRGQFIETALAEMSRYIAVTSEGDVQIEAKMAEANDVQQPYVNIALDLAELHRLLIKPFLKGGFNHNNSENVQGLKNKFHPYFRLVAEGKANINAPASGLTKKELEESATTQKNCGGSKEDPHPCPPYIESATFRDSKSDIQNILQSNGFHETSAFASYPGGTYGDGIDFTKTVSAFDCAPRAFRTHALIREVNGQWTYKTQSPEPNPELDKYVFQWPSASWPTYVEWWHTNFC